jgi:hypothetical protein
VLCDLAVAGGDERGDGAEEPQYGLAVAGKRDGWRLGETQEYGEGEGDKDGGDVNLAKGAMEAQVSLADSSGKLEGADEEGGESGESVRDEDEALGEELGAKG